METPPSNLTTVVDLTVVIPALNEEENLELLLPSLRKVLKRVLSNSGLDYEIILVDGVSSSKPSPVAAQNDIRVVSQVKPGYGNALLCGFDAARGEYILTMDADLSHEPGFVEHLWEARHAADVSIASRYVMGGQSDTHWLRMLLSKILNRWFAFGLSLPVTDLSSGFRLYRTRVLRTLGLDCHDFDILPEILVKAYAGGWRIQEVPFHYQPRKYGKSHARVIRFGITYLRTFISAWYLRNSIACADYDARAYDSKIPLQRYWHRQRYTAIRDMIEKQGTVLDVGAGSSRIITLLPDGSVVFDIQTNKLRFARRYGKTLVQGSAFNLPFPDESYPCVVCSQVIEHLPSDPEIFDELDRVLCPGGLMVIGTPDYGGRVWPVVEKLYALFSPWGYADEHITHYSREFLSSRLTRMGYRIEVVRYVFRAELIMAFRKS